MAQHLPPEILERVFAAILTWDFTSHSYRTSKAGAREDLKRASLVCSAWRHPAQSRLHCVLSLKTLDELDGLSSWPATFAGQWRVLRLCLYNEEVAPAQRLHPSMLKAQIHLFKAVKHLHIETHNTEDDMELAELIASFHNLQVLVIAHAQEYYEYDSDDEDDIQKEEWEPSRYETHLTSHFPSLLLLALPALPYLRHLAVVRVDFGDTIVKDLKLPCRLQSLVLMLSKCRYSVLQILLDGSQQTLRHLALYQPRSITTPELIKAIKPCASQLAHLALIFPWRDHTFPPRLVAWGDKLTGVVVPVLAEAQSLRSLHCQDSDFTLADARSLPHLETVTFASDDLTTVDHDLQFSRGQYNHLAVNVPNFNREEIEAFEKKWDSPELAVEYSDAWYVEYAHMRRFGRELPDPILD